MAEQSPKKKVLLAITKSNFGGAQRYVYDIARLLPSQEFEVVVAHGGKGILAEKLQRVGVRTIEVPGLARDISLLSDIAAFISLIRILRNERPDIVHLNSSKMGLVGGLAARFVGVRRIIFTAHGWPFHEERPALARVILRILARLTVILSHRTIAVSESVAHAVDPTRGMSKLSVIHNGIEEIILLPRNDARELLVPSHGDNEFWFGTIAELHPIKGLSFAIEAFYQHSQTHPDSRYIIIGDGEESSRLEEKIRILGLQNRVHLCGFRDNASQYLAAFDAFVLPSLSEAISFAILEAGAASIPVIATQVGGIPEIIANKNDGILVPPQNTDALAEGMEKIVGDLTYREALGKKLHSRVTSEFSLTEMFRKTKAAYLE